jgi:hypothetical protein
MDSFRILEDTMDHSGHVMDMGGKEDSIYLLYFRRRHEHGYGAHVDVHLLGREMHFYLQRYFLY